MTKKVGVEAEYIILNDKGAPKVVPAGWDVDNMPLLGEIRGEPGTSWDQATAEFQRAHLMIVDRLERHQKSWNVEFLPSLVVEQKLYKEVMKGVDLNNKQEGLRQVRNIYGTNIEDYTDQVIEDKKVVGSRISCGLHIHFSYSSKETKKITRSHFEKVTIPLSVGTIGDQPMHLDLYKKVSDKEEEVVSVEVSKFTRPAIYAIVEAMDKEFFDRFAPEASERTKYRQPGFYELKSYGFEYRSLPATRETISALPEITKKAFEVLHDLDKF